MSTMGDLHCDLFERVIVSDLLIFLYGGWFECILHVAPVIYRRTASALRIETSIFTKHPSVEKRSLPACTLSLSMPNQTNLAKV